MAGKKNWYFADGYLPEKVNNGEMEAHEALMFFNTSDQPINIKVHVYFSDRDPIKNIPFTVGAERVMAIRLDKPEEMGGAVIPPVTQYALYIEAEAPVVCQFGRLDTTQNAMAYYAGIGYAE